MKVKKKLKTNVKSIKEKRKKNFKDNLLAVETEEQNFFQSKYDLRKFNEFSCINIGKNKERDLVPIINFIKIKIQTAKKEENIYFFLKEKVFRLIILKKMKKIISFYFQKKIQKETRIKLYFLLIIINIFFLEK